MSNTFEAKKDFSAEFKLAVPESITIADEKSLEDAIAYLLPLEKKCRVNNDFTNLKEVSVHMVRLCRQKLDWDKLNAVLALINKRSSQYKVTLTAVVEEALTYLDITPTVEVKIELIKALKEVCDGKIYLEAESAKLHFTLSAIYEGQGKLSEACDIIQDVHVETYGSLSKNEKATYILEQIRINLLKKDYIRVAIHSRKMNSKTLEEDGFESIKLHYYRMQIEFFLYEKNTWEICQAYYKIATTKILPEIFTLQESQVALESCILFLLASKRDNHQADMLHRIKLQLTTYQNAASYATSSNNNISSLTVLHPAVRHALMLFSTEEIILTPFPGQKDGVETHLAWSMIPSNSSSSNGKGSNSCSLPAEEKEAFLEKFQVRIIEHNLRMVAKYYSRITMTRLMSLMNLSAEVLEYHLSELSYSGDLTLKIDRPLGVIVFQAVRSSEEILSEWSGDITKMLSLMEATCHLINRETMVHKV